MLFQNIKSFFSRERDLSTLNLLIYASFKQLFNSKLLTPNSKLLTPNFKLLTPNSKLLTLNSKLQTPNSKLFTFHFSLFTFSLIVLCTFSCKKDTTTYDIGYGYQPLETGLTWVYQADSIVYDAFEKDTFYFSFQIKEYIDSAFIDNAGETAYKMVRYKRKTETAPWVIQKVGVIKKTHNHIEQVEDNIRYIKLIFPIKEFYSWNANAMNDSIKAMYKYKNVNQPYKLYANTIDSSLTVIQFENKSILKKQSAMEVYSKGIGMVYKELVDIDLQKQEGFEYYLHLKSFDKKK